MQYVQQVEAAYVRRVVEILEPVVGRDNLRANVTADIDFSQTESTSEEFKPNQGDAPATVEAAPDQRIEPARRRGAQRCARRHEQPAAGAGHRADQRRHAAAAGGAGRHPQPTAAAAATRVTQYEVDKTVRVTRNATGTVRRLNAAVVLNHRVVTDAKGKSTSTPLSGDEIEKLTALVQQSLGFNQERGDSVRVINAPFRVEAPAKIDEPPLYKQPWAQDLLRGSAGAAGAGRGGVAGRVHAHPPDLEEAARTRPCRAPGSQLNVVAGNDVAGALPGPGNVPALAGPRTDERLDHARSFAKQNPQAVASIVKGWVGGEPA